jgi:hypothetical protein
MEGMDEEKKRKILYFLGRKYTESPDDLFSLLTIAENCEMDETEVKKICTNLVSEGLIQKGKDEDGHSYKIGINGLILLERYASEITPKARIDIDKVKKIVKRGLDKMQIMNLELQSGVVEVGKKHNLRDGLYYVVVIDLVGSTLTSSKMNGTAFNGWIKEFIKITREALSRGNRNLTVFVKSVGDGALFLFRNFEDILDWKNKVDELCSHHNNLCKRHGKPDFVQYHHKTIIHLGEVYFDRTNYDANAFGIHLAFKIEKKFGKDEIGITDTVKQTILQEINSGKFGIHNVGSYSFDENENTVIPLWKLTSLS